MGGTASDHPPKKQSWVQVAIIVAPLTIAAMIISVGLAIKDDKDSDSNDIRSQSLSESSLRGTAGLETRRAVKPPVEMIDAVSCQGMTAVLKVLKPRDDKSDADAVIIEVPGHTSFETNLSHMDGTIRLCTYTGRKACAEAVEGQPPPPEDLRAKTPLWLVENLTDSEQRFSCEFMPEKKEGSA